MHAISGNVVVAHGLQAVVAELICVNEQAIYMYLADTTYPTITLLE